MENKYDLFIKLLNFNSNKYKVEQVFKDFISLFAISLSNKVVFNKDNSERYERIYQKYDKGERFNFYAMSAELTRIFCNEKDPYDVLGEIYQKITNKNYLQLVKKVTPLQEVGRKLLGVVNINKKANNGKMVEVNCGSGAMILAYASTLKMFKLNYKIDLEVTAIDTDIINVFITYIQLYFFDISAVVILVDEISNKELMKLYTPVDENDLDNLMAA